MHYKAKRQYKLQFSIIIPAFFFDTICFSKRQQFFLYGDEIESQNQRYSNFINIMEKIMDLSVEYSAVKRFPVFKLRSTILYPCHRIAL